MDSNSCLVFLGASHKPDYVASSTLGTSTGSKFRGFNQKSTFSTVHKNGNSEPFLFLGPLLMSLESLMQLCWAAKIEFSRSPDEVKHPFFTGSAENL